MVNLFVELMANISCSKDDETENQGNTQLCQFGHEYQLCLKYKSNT